MHPLKEAPLFSFVNSMLITLSLWTSSCNGRLLFNHVQRKPKLTSMCYCHPMVISFFLSPSVNPERQKETQQPRRNLDSMIRGIDEKTVFTLHCTFLCLVLWKAESQYPEANFQPKGTREGINAPCYIVHYKAEGFVSLVIFVYF